MSWLYDASAMYAVVDRTDQAHRAARAFLRTTQGPLVTNELVAGEAFTLIRKRLGGDAAFRFITVLRSSTLFVVHPFDSELSAVTWAVLDELRGIPLSHADASLIALGRRLGIGRVFAFDGDFRAAGLDVAPTA